MSQQAVEQFEEMYLEAALHDPSNPLSLYAQANNARARGDMVGWRAATEAAFQLPHDSHRQRYCRAWAKLTLGDWSAWADYEARINMPENSTRLTRIIDWIQWTHCMWDGREDLTDKTVLVLSEQGIGDTIQMLRFIPLLAERSKSVICTVYPRLVPLAQVNFPERVRVVIDGDARPFLFDRYVWSMSLPALLGQLPTFVPLRAPGRRPLLNNRVRPFRGGICWAGNPAYAGDDSRSMPANRIQPLINRADIEWHCLQAGSRAIDADCYPTMMKPWPSLITFGDTADLIKELDFVVTVDTAVGHLAGGLGVPTFLLLSRWPDGRWGLGDRTPWYPSMRLMRQRDAGDWDGVIEQVNEAIDQFMARPPSVLGEVASHLERHSCEVVHA